MKTFEKEIEVRWSDVDQNRHLRHSAYYDYGAHIRIRYFAKIGFDAGRMSELQIGPILFREECSFIREIKPDDIVRINILRGPVSEDGSRWVLHHELFNAKGEKSAQLTLNGAWMDLNKRKLTTPPAKLTESILSLPEGEPYVYKKSGGSSS